MLRDEIFKIVPEPNNKEVVIYNNNIIDLLNVDVKKKYIDDYSLYKLKKNNYDILLNSINEYQNNIDNIYLFNKKWNKQDYVNELQKEKINYGKIYNNIKKIENDISILEKKYKGINEKIILQTQKDKADVEKKKKDLDIEILELKNKIIDKKNIITELKNKEAILNENIIELQEDKELILSMKKDLENDEYECKYCGTIIKAKNSKGRISKLLDKNLLKNKNELDTLLQQKNKLDAEINLHNSQLIELKQNLNNDIQFRKEDYNFYIKKTVLVLKLESERDITLNKIEELKKEYQNNSQTKTKSFLELKDKIEKCELSLENLDKLEQYKIIFQDKVKEKNELKEELLKLYNNIIHYKEFLEIYYKIYQQKINTFFGENFNFKLFRFEDLELKEICEVYYKGIILSDLDITTLQEVNEIIKQKIYY